MIAEGMKAVRMKRWAISVVLRSKFKKKIEDDMVINICNFKKNRIEGGMFS